MLEFYICGMLIVFLLVIVNDSIIHSDSGCCYGLESFSFSDGLGFIVFISMLSWVSVTVMAYFYYLCFFDCDKGK